MLHHDGEEADDHLGARPDEHLALAALLCIVDAFESIGQNVHPHHGACREGSSYCTGSSARKRRAELLSGLILHRKHPTLTERCIKP